MLLKVREPNQRHWACPACTGAEKEKWRVGAVMPLAQAEEAPLLGQLPEGKSVLTLECGMFRAAAVPHTPSECVATGDVQACMVAWAQRQDAAISSNLCARPVAFG